MAIKRTFLSLVVVVLLWINIAIVTAVEIAQHPSSASGIEGGTITLQCGVNTEFRPGVHRLYWAFYGAPGAHTFLSVDRSIYSSLAASKRGRYSIGGGVGRMQIDFDLIISNLQMEDSGTYECILYDPFTGQRMTSSDTSKVVVIPQEPYDRGPICSMTPRTTRLGVSTTFTCYTHGGLPRPKLTWRRAGVNMTSVLNSTEDAGLEIITHTKYISNFDNNVTYTCTAEHPALPRNRTCSIVPFEVPVRTYVTSMQPVKLGSNAEFFCRATGMPQVNRYKWFVGRGDKFERVAKTEGRYYVSSTGTYLKITNVAEKDEGLSVRCVAKNSIDMKGVNEAMLSVRMPRPTSNVDINPTTRQRMLTTVRPKPGADGRPGTDGRSGFDHNQGFGRPNYGGKDTGARGDSEVYSRNPQRPFRPGSSADIGYVTVNPNGERTIKQRAFDNPHVTYKMSNNDLEQARASSGMNMTLLVRGATGLFLVVVIVFLVLVLVLRRSQSTKPVKSARGRAASMRPYSTGTLTKSDIVILPVPSADEDEKEATKPVGSDDDFKPGLSGSANAIDDYAEARFFKNKKTNVSKSTGNLVYVELDFGKSKTTDNVNGEDKTHYAEIRMSRNLSS